jgi:hypothetical protein
MDMNTSLARRRYGGLEKLCLATELYKNQHVSVSGPEAFPQTGRSHIAVSRRRDTCPSK